MGILSLIVFLPLVASGIICILPHSQAYLYKWICLIASLMVLALAGQCYWQFDKAYEYLQFEENLPWLQFAFGSLGIFKVNYHLGVDGLNMALLLLATFVQLIASISSFEITEKTKGYFATFLILSSSILGCFLAQDFFLFFLFFEFMLLPMYFLIGIWGGKNRAYASIKFFIYTLFGSVLILIVMIGLFTGTGNPEATALVYSDLGSYEQLTKEMIYATQESFADKNITEASVVKTLDFRHLADKYNILSNSILHPANNNTILGLSFREWAFFLLFLGFAIKLPLVPFHTWLPDAHVEAPTAISVILAGTLLKVGGYGFIRIAYLIFPDVAPHFANFIAALAVISIIWGALNALAQTDLKKLVAYSSVSHMGFVMLAIAAFSSQGFEAAIFQMVSHGVLSAMLFLIVGVLYIRTHDRQIASYQGLAQHMPMFTFMVAVAFFASMGLPLFSGFIGEFFSIMAAFASNQFPKYFAGLATFGIVLGAAYFLYIFKKMWLNIYWVRANIILSDLDLREKIMLYSLAIITLILGVYPKIIFDLSAFTVSQLSIFK